MRKTLKTLALTLVLVLCLTSFAPALAEDKVTIRWLGYYTSNITVSADTYAEKLIEDAFNVEIIPVTDVSAENMDMFIASGDILDITCYASYLEGDFQYMYEQEMIREFPEEWLWEYYPTGMKVYEDYLGREFFEEGNHLVNGRCLYTPFTTTTNTSEFVMLYRKDWLDNLGMKEPTTLDELHDMLYAFTYNDPDGNGVKDTYGIDVSSGWCGLWPVIGAFGLTNTLNGNGSFRLNPDGTVTYSTVTEEYKQALAVIEQWYQEGILDPNGITDDRSAVRTKWANGTIGAMVDSQTWFYSNRGSSSIVAMVEEVYGANTVDILGPITSQYGDGKVYASRNYPMVTSNRALSFTADATDEQIIAVLKILEGMTADHELMIKILFGEENVDYTMTEDGQLQVLPHVSIEYMASKGISDTFYGYGATDPYMATLTFSAKDRALIEKADAWPMLYTARNFTDVKNEAKDQYLAEVQKLEKEFYHSVLLGTVDLETGWDTYVNNMHSAGLTKILAEYEELLK